VVSERDCFGMPSDMGKSKSRAFKYLREKVWKNVLGWSEQLFWVGRIF
jgi:hypothetical protein